jgi:hypothetical protein
MLKGMMESLLTKMREFHEEMMAMVDALLEGTKACREETETCRGKTGARIEAGQETRKAEIKTELEEEEAIVQHQKVPNEEAAAEIIGALEDRYGNLHLPI